MNIELIGVEVGVLLPPEDEEFGFYSVNNPELPFGFYDENQYAVREDCFDRERRYVEEYVLNGVDGTYGVISVQGYLEETPETASHDELTDYTELSYGFFKNAGEVLFSVCKRDGKLVEGFLEAELHKLAEKSVEQLVVNAGERSVATQEECGLSPEPVQAIGG